MMLYVITYIRLQNCGVVQPTRLPHFFLRELSRNPLTSLDQHKKLYATGTNLCSPWTEPSDRFGSMLQATGQNSLLSLDQPKELHATGTNLCSPWTEANSNSW